MKSDKDIIKIERVTFYWDAVYIIIWAAVRAGMTALTSCSWHLEKNRKSRCLWHTVDCDYYNIIDRRHCSLLAGCHIW